ncbi:glycoside hydrolase family 53 protein [Alkalitalea saponilacus]|uniref:Arabinogalactan endo-beta-1,4-galactanase n=1 Tax=Alkalitalea saponilacus TaxID=889453 RepID=A0A1T5HLD8_9BACT|nr:glycosyl hydrolase 53 family protein [Alkalitalea saponilacus]ASB47819.1 hypothetical protein CDL62_00960 [Alkalitalea saponilacus]SKC21508.1 arabinogalactan endo-1,4-beta-galactosidase [Alkalitalea saponilacus]
MRQFIYISLLLLISGFVSAQTFYRGNDLSYVNQMEDCGAVFKEDGIPKDPFRIFADQGTNLVRVRLWHNPDWQNRLSQPEGVKSQYSDFEDVKLTIMRAKAEGMKVMLDFHLSDFWADPGQQLIPSAWLSVANNVDLLADSVYNYVSKVLLALDEDDLMPEIVKIGNENNAGILRHTTLSDNFQVSGSVSDNWSRHARLFNAGIRAVRDVGADASVNPRVALHFSNIRNSINWYQRLIDNGVTDFDIIGLSYYYAWHGFSIADLGNTIRSMRNRWSQYDVMVVETGYLWTTENFDSLGNIINTPDPEYLPVTPLKQLEYMVDYTREVKRSGGIGVIFWEPAWVSTPCRTPWGVGSSHDHVVFFDPLENNFMENGGGRWTNAEFYENVSNSRKVTFKVDMEERDTEGGVYLSGSWGNGELLKMESLGNNVFWTFAYLPVGSEGGYFFVDGNDISNRETIPEGCANWEGIDRKYQVGNSNVIYEFVFGSCAVITKINPTVTFMVDMSGQDVSRGVFITGEITQPEWTIEEMSHLGDGIYSWTTQLTPGDDVLAYYFMTNSNWDNLSAYREVVPAECHGKWSDRGIVVGRNDTIVRNVWSSCETFGLTSAAELNQINDQLAIVTNSGNFKEIHIHLQSLHPYFDIVVYNSLGTKLYKRKVYDGIVDVHVAINSSGLHFVHVSNGINTEVHKVILR